MINKKLFIENTIQPKILKVKRVNSFSKKFNKALVEIKKDINNENKTANVLNAKFKFNFKIENLKKFKKFKTIVLIGMGGSILGAEAIYNFFQTSIKKRVYFFDDLDENKLIHLKKKEKLSKTLFIIISKSGNTIETLANTFALNIIKNKSKNVIIISEKKNNSLFLLSNKFNLFYIEHQKHIGGRYSVLSEVGVVPAYLMGIDVNKLRSKILDWFKGDDKILLKNISVKVADLISSKKINNLVFLNYTPELEKFLYWCQQLIAESLGKKNKGLLPVISNVPKDHHSLLQLYLDGPKDKFFNIFSFNKKSKVRVNFEKNLNINFFLNKKISEIKNAQRHALTKSFKNKNIPFCKFEIRTGNEAVLGKLFSFL